MMLAPVRPDAYGTPEEVATWLEALAARLRASAAAGPVAMRVHARVETVTWDPQDCQRPCPRLAGVQAFGVPPTLVGLHDPTL